MPKRSKTQLDKVDPKRALVTLHYEMLDDWYRDPWSWPELDWLIDQETAVNKHLRSSGTRRVAKVDVPKENFGTRPASVLDPLDRLVYMSLVDRISLQLLGSLPEFVHGWRLRSGDPRRGVWSHNSFQNAAYRSSLDAGATRFTSGLKSDIVSFFASIKVDQVVDLIVDRCRRGLAVSRLTGMIRSFNEVSGRGGLIQRSTASAALANSLLGPVDDVLRRHHGPPPTPSKKTRFRLMLAASRSARWMDDIWAFDSSPAVLRNLQHELEAAMRELGLEPNIGKTFVLEGSDLKMFVTKVQHSAIDDALQGATPDPRPLEELIEEILESPALANRTTIKFAASRLQNLDRSDLVEAFAASMSEMPHGADALGRLFRATGQWREMPDALVRHHSSPWATTSWATAQLATMFPSRLRSKSLRRELESVTSLFFDCLGEETQLPLLAVAAHRLAAWRPDDARLALREAAASSADPHHRRVVALAALGAGEARSMVKSMLSEFEENQLTKEMLVARNFQVPVAKDFLSGSAN